MRRGWPRNITRYSWQDTYCDMKQGNKKTRIIITFKYENPGADILWLVWNASCPN